MSTRKYKKRRNTLFSRFDEGVQLDDESWWSVTPEAIAEHTASRIARARERAGETCTVLVDACCGAGGNTIQFSETCDLVLSVDVDPHKLELARHNLNVYGRGANVELVMGDWRSLSRSMRADVVFMSPPWGGPSYRNKSPFELSDVRPMSGEEWVSCARRVAPSVALFLPVTTDASQLASLGDPLVEVEVNVLNGRPKTITAFFGPLVDGGQPQKVSPPTTQEQESASGAKQEEDQRLV